MGLLFIIALIFIVIEFIFIWLDLGLLGFFLGLIFIGAPLYFLYKRDAKYSDSDRTKRHSINKSNLILLFVICFAQLVIYPPISDYSMDTEDYVELKEKYEDGDYQSIVSSISLHQRDGFSFTRADKLKVKAIDKWIRECKASEDSTCIDEIFKLATLDTDLEYAAAKEFNFDKEKYYEELFLKEELKDKMTHYPEPFYGMEEKFINTTYWGIPKEKKNIGNKNSSYTVYSWVVCKNGKQISRTAEVMGGKVITVNVNSFELSELRPEHIKCPK